MPAAKKNSSLRIIVPIIVLAAAIGIVLALGSNAQNQTRKRTTQNQNAAQVDDTTPSPSGGDETKSPETQSGSEADQPADDQPVPADPEAPEADQPEQPAADGADDGAQPTTDDGVFDGLKARVFGPNPADGIAETLGSPYFDSDYDFEIELTYLGAGIKRILLNKEFETANELVEARERKDAGETNIQVEGQYVLVHMGEMPVVQADGSTVTYRLVPLAAYAMQVGDQTIDLFGGISGQLWRTGDQPGELVAEIENASGQLVARVVRTYQVDPDSYDIVVEQRVENLTDRELRFSFIQEGPLDLDRDRAGYSLLSMQRVRYGYTLKNQANWQDPQVKADGRLTRMQSVINDVNKAWSKGLGADSLWPPRKPFSGADELVWIAQTNRYFGMIVHPLLDPSAPADKGFDLIGRVDPILLANSDNDGKGRLSMRITSPEFVAPPASAADLSFGVYAGPLDRREMAAQEDPRIAGLQLSEIVVYNIGGMCAFCTFEWLGNMLLFVLHIFHDYIVFDWALSIILLVLVVRTILHPIFKRSQIGIQKFAKDMQRVQPKLKKLQEKYKNDRQKLMQEQQKLFRSEGVSYTGALGCLPMFMQSPIWIALYAMLYLNHELRHEPAFFGVFQSITGGDWLFLADLARSDRFIPLGTGFDLPMLGHIDSINILPLLLGFVFFVQQKYMSPPPSATMTDEQRAQQKMIKVMMVVLFPVFMYTAPAALTLYFVTNSTFAIIEGRWIRAHIDTLELDKHPDERSYQPKPKRVRNTAAPGMSKRERVQEQRAKNRYKKRN
ncbi:MAG: membrane protein insertase YidC [Phycisphaerales bacterium JB065]